MHAPWRLWHALGALAILLLSSVARAEQPRIVLVTNHADAAILPLLRAELLSFGMEVVEVQRSDQEVLPGDLSAAARSLHAVAAFRVLVSSRTVEVWIADRVTGKVVLREIFAQGEDSKVEERLVVVQAIELLRASLMELEAPHPPRGEIAPTPALARASASEERERFSFALAPTVIGSPGGAGAALGAAAAVAWRATWLGAGLVAGSSITPARLVRAAGAAELTTRWVGAEMLALRPPSPSPWKPRAGLGVAVLFGGLRGVAEPPGRSLDTSLVSVAPMVHSDLGYAFTRNLRLTASVTLLTPLRWSTIVFDGQEVGTYGRLFLMGSLGLEAVTP